MAECYYYESLKLYAAEKIPDDKLRKVPQQTEGTDE